MLVRARVLGETSQRPANRRIEVPFQQRQDLVAQPITRIGQIEIGAVIAPGYIATSELLAQTASRALEQRPDQTPARRRDARQSSKTSAAHHAKEHRLSLVIFRVSGRHTIRRSRRNDASKKFLPRATAPDFEGDVIASCQGWHVDVRDLQRHLEPSGQCFAKLLVRIGLLATNAVMQVSHRDQRQVASLVQLA